MFDITQEENYRELTLEEQYLVNGGERIENSDAAVAAGAPGDVLKRNDGSEVVITQGDINAAQKKLGLTGSGGNLGEGNGVVTGSGGNNNTSTSSGGPSGNPGGSGPESGGSDNRGYPSSMDGMKDSSKNLSEKGYPSSTDGLKKTDILPEILPNGDLIAKESDVIKFLQEIGKNPDDYAIEAYERKAICKYPWKKGGSDSLLVHSLYVITNKKTREVYTLSFNGTKYSAKSEGAWGLNTETDVEGLRDSKYGDNSYSMLKLFNGYTIDTERTVTNIINSINSSTTYYFIDHKKDMPNMENCNTALYNTVFFEFMK